MPTAAALGMLALGLPVSSAMGQALAQVEQTQQVQRIRELAPGQVSPEDPALYPGEEEDTGEQLLLQTAPPHGWQWINLSLDSQYLHTSNAYLTTQNKTGAGLLISTIDGEVDAPALNLPFGPLYGRAGYQYQWFNYGLGGPGGKVGDLDFDAATTYIEGACQLPGDWYVTGNLSYTRLLTDGSGYHEFYKELVPTLRVEKSVQLRANVEASVEYAGNYRVTDEPAFPNLGRSCNNRTDQSLEFAVTWQFAKRMDLRPFYSFQYSYYPSYYDGQSRNDYLHTLGVYVDYYVNSWSSIRVYVSYDAFKSSAASVQDYRKLDAGGGISAAFKF